MTKNEKETKRTFLYGNRPAVKEGLPYSYVKIAPLFGMVFLTSNEGTVVLSTAKVRKLAALTKNEVLRGALVRYLSLVED